MMSLKADPQMNFSVLRTHAPQILSTYDFYPLKMSILEQTTSIQICFYLWCAFKLMCILIPKYSDMKFGGGVKVFTINIRGAGHSVQGFHLTRLHYSIQQRLIGLTILQPVERVQLGFSSVGCLSAWPLHQYLTLSRNDIQFQFLHPFAFFQVFPRAQPQGCGGGRVGVSLSPCQVKPVVSWRIGSFRQIMANGPYRPIYFMCLKLLVL